MASVQAANAAASWCCQQTYRRLELLDHPLLSGSKGKINSIRNKQSAIRVVLKVVFRGAGIHESPLLHARTQHRYAVSLPS